MAGSFTQGTTWILHTERILYELIFLKKFRINKKLSRLAQPWRRYCTYNKCPTNLACDCGEILIVIPLIHKNVMCCSIMIRLCPALESCLNHKLHIYNLKQNLLRLDPLNTELILEACNQHHNTHLHG